MIILNTKTNKERDNEYGIYPDFFVPESKKRSKQFIKDTIDYFYGEAIRQYTYNCRTWAHNYRFVKGQLRPEDFYENQEVTAFSFDLVTEDVPLPEYVQQYSILNQPLNTLSGEQSAKPDTTKVKAFDDDSRSEELAFKTEILNQYIISKVQIEMQGIAAQQGIDLNTDEGAQQIQQMTEEKLSDMLSDYTTQGEKWGNHILTAMKMDFNIKELSEEAFRDLLIAGRERFHIYEDQSKLGFNVECVNPKNVWKLSSPDKRYFKDAYAAGIISLMEISEIIEKFALTKEEIDHLRKSLREDYKPEGEQSNLFNNKTGIDSIHYNLRDPLDLERRLSLESNLMRDQSLGEIGEVKEFGILGQKFIVLQEYHLAKRKIGKVTYIDQDEVEQTLLVDENYHSGDHPQQVGPVEWGYVNQWWKGLKIGCDIYYSEPLECLDYCPIIGADFENRNSEVKSMIDLMKPYQMIYNVCMNQLWEFLQKEYGPVLEFNAAKIPTNKDASYEDSLDQWLTTARDLGILIKDDSPENTGRFMSNTDTVKVHDLTLTNQLQSRLNIAMQIKELCHSLVGITPERLGAAAATQTATGTNAALQSSFSQTQPFFVQHDYTMNQLYQAILDFAQYIEQEKPTSTVSYITNEGESAFIQVQGEYLKLKDLRTYVTNREKDERIFQQLQSLAQPMLQNGADFATVADMYITDSLRELRQKFKKDQKKREAQMQQQNEIAQQQIQAQQEATQAQIQAAIQQKQMDQAFEARENQLDRISKERTAIIQASSKESSTPSSSYDPLDASRLDADVLQANRDYELQQSKLQNDQVLQQNKIAQDQKKQEIDNEKWKVDVELKKEKLDVEREKIAAAKVNPVVGENKTKKK